MGSAEQSFNAIAGELDHPMLVVTAAAGENVGGCLVGFASQGRLYLPRAPKRELPHGLGVVCLRRLEQESLGIHVVGRPPCSVTIEKRCRAGRSRPGTWPARPPEAHRGARGAARSNGAITTRPARHGFPRCPPHAPVSPRWAREPPWAASPMQGTPETNAAEPDEVDRGDPDRGVRVL